jgi:hypothetical protein
MRSYYAIQAFRQLLDTGQRCEVRGAIPGQFAASAGRSRDNSRATILLSNFAHSGDEFRLVLRSLPRLEERVVEVRRGDEKHVWEATRLESVTAPTGFTVSLKNPSFCLITLDLPAR